MTWYWIESQAQDHSPPYVHRQETNDKVWDLLHDFPRMLRAGWWFGAT